MTQPPALAHEEHERVRRWLPVRVQVDEVRPAVVRLAEPALPKKRR